uniref:Uncharacterized protein n=1 Tax=Parascaris equorum TaxID=6256 RepID=A0A914RNK6_PAREQ
MVVTLARWPVTRMVIDGYKKEAAMKCVYRQWTKISGSQQAAAGLLRHPEPGIASGRQTVECVCRVQKRFQYELVVMT